MPSSSASESRPKELGPEQTARIREYLLASSQQSCVARELWSCGSGTYAAHRACLEARRRAAQEAAEAASRGALRAAAPLHTLPATVKYSFEGVKHVLADSTAAVTALAFASARNDLLAYGGAEGDMWFVGLPPGAPPVTIKARRMHSHAVVAVDWSYDNSQLLSIGLGGSLVVWDTAALLQGEGPAAGGAGGSGAAGAGAGTAGAGARGPAGGRPEGAASAQQQQQHLPEVNPIRTIWAPTATFLCGKFHRINFSLAMVGTASGAVEVHSCSTGMLHSRCPIATGVQVTAIDVSNHHVFVGDSTGTLHLLACELHGKQLTKLRHTTKLRLAPGGAQAAAAAASTAVIMRLRPSICPLSVIHDVPLITYGSDDTTVYIVDVTARSFAAGRGAGGGGGGGGHGNGGNGGGGGAPAADRPLTVTVLKAHRAAVTAVGWSYDEALLASADADGTVVLWQRSRLF